MKREGLGVGEYKGGGQEHWGRSQRGGVDETPKIRREKTIASKRKTKSGERKEENSNDFGARRLKA